jgi:dimethylsulfone monooxygenase
MTSRDVAPPASPAQAAGPTLPEGNAFQLGLFGVNTDGGIAITKVAERWRARWDDIAWVTQYADRAGLEFILPIARWKGYGGATNVRNHSFETLTHGAALAAITKRIMIFATVHVPLVHPVFAAKALSTIDHVSNGRAGLNIVCGWNQDEFDMFGHTQHAHGRRYEQGYEWFDIVQRIFASGGVPFDFKGAFYDLKGVSGEPAPVQSPRPLTMSAASSPAGRTFAARTSDLLFTTFADLTTGQRQLAEIRALGTQEGRAFDVLTACHVVCRDTDAEAQAYYRRYADEEADAAAVDFHINMTLANSKADPALVQDRVRRAAGLSSFALVGSPDTVARGLIAIHQAGFTGTSLSFVDFRRELPLFIENVMPLLREAGLRSM